MQVVHPRWTTWTLLVYVGGLTIAVGLFVLLVDVAEGDGRAAIAGWALALVAVLVAVAEAFRRTGHPLAAGVLATAAVSAFAVLLVSLFIWWGWNIVPALRGFHGEATLLELLEALAILVALRRYRFPLLVSQLLFVVWLAVVDALSDGGAWTAVVSILVGLVYLLAGISVDAGERRPYGFWLHLAAGLAMGGGVLYWLRHGQTFDWIVIGLASIAYVQLARRLGRTSWAVLGILGVLATAEHFGNHWSRTVPYATSLYGVSLPAGRLWAWALVYLAAGTLLVALGFRAARGLTESTPEP